MNTPRPDVRTYYYTARTGKRRIANLSKYYIKFVRNIFLVELFLKVRVSPNKSSVMECGIGLFMMLGFPKLDARWGKTDSKKNCILIPKQTKNLKSYIDTPI